MSIPHSNNVHDSVDDDRITEMEGFEAPFMSVSYGPGVSPDGTRKLLGPIPPYLFNKLWQN